MRLSELKTGEQAVIIKVFGHGGFRRRIMEMGFVRGQKVKSILNAPLNDPIKYGIMGFEVSLRRSEAYLVDVVIWSEGEKQDVVTEESLGSSPQIETEKLSSSKSMTINVALVGNPNSGKTSIFNALSGGHEHVGNYSGVTVGAKEGEFNYKNYKIKITDLPGTYALSAYTPEELYVRRHLINDTPDIVINSVVASNLERNLYLSCELIDINTPMVVALNMYDELKKSGSKLDYKYLGAMLGVPMVPIVAKTHEGLDDLLDCVINVYENKESSVRAIKINHSAAIEKEIEVICNLFEQEIDCLPPYFSLRYLALKFLEQDLEIEQILKSTPNYYNWQIVRDKSIERIKKTLGEDVETAVTNEKYGFIEGALKETYIAGVSDRNPKTKFIDSLVTNKYLGFPIFMLFMYLMFSATFIIGSYPQEWIENLFAYLGEWVSNIMSDGPLKDLIANGIIGGVGGVIVFLPNILILYLFISLMEDSGYMARAAFIMDKIMHKIGLHGKSFIPLLMGFGCNVPAIMATRTIESRSSRLITIMINPFMSCSARLPVFILLSGIFFPNNAGLALSGMYLLGVVVAIFTARIMRRFMFKTDETPFVMELPPYRVPTANAAFRHMWEKGEQYLKKIGGVILLASIAIWFLSYYPNKGENPKDSYLGKVGKFCEPAMEPIGLNWKSSVALLSGTAAKEIIVSTLGVLYSNEDVENDGKLSAQIIASNDYNNRSALSFMIFILLYFPCVATLGAIAHESGTWRWAAVSVIYNTTLAWFLAFMTYNLIGLL